MTVHADNCSVNVYNSVYQLTRLINFDSNYKLAISLPYNFETIEIHEKS